MDTKRKTDVAASLVAKKAKLDADIDFELQDEIGVNPMAAWERPKPPPIDPRTYALGLLSIYFLILQIW